MPKTFVPTFKWNPLWIKSREETKDKRNKKWKQHNFYLCNVLFETLFVRNIFFCSPFVRNNFVSNTFIRKTFVRKTFFRNTFAQNSFVRNTFVRNILFEVLLFEIEYFVRNTFRPIFILASFSCNTLTGNEIFKYLRHTLRLCFYSYHAMPWRDSISRPINFNLE
jgi:hypothetical protein